MVTDLDQYDPNSSTPDEPVEYDGTPRGTTERGTLSPEIQDWTNSATQLMNQIQSWWEGWWPRIHLVLSLSTPMGGLATLHISVDLLGDIRSENSVLDSPILDTMSDVEMLRLVYLKKVGYHV